MNATAIKSESSRDISLDYLKCIALLGLVIAHISTNEYLLQLRCFDVNLLVIISAMLGCERVALSDVGNKLQCIRSYYIKRFCRLVLPTWIFVTFYFWLNSIFKFQELTTERIIRTYLLQDASLGYVWIIYIYLICALMMPLLVHIDLRKRSHAAIFILLFCLYLAIKDVSTSYLFRIFVLYPIIYGLISVIGVNFRRVSLRVWTTLGVFGLTLFTAIALCLWRETGTFVYTGSTYKYPPQIYYLAYTIGCALLLLVLAEKTKKCIKGNRFVSYIGSSTLWLYLWHILGLQIAKRLSEYEFLRMLIVIAFSLAVVSIQKRLVYAVERRTGRNQLLSLFKG